MVEINEKLSSSLPPDVMSDIQAIADAAAANRPVDPEIAKRIRERAQRITDELFQKYGLLDIGVPAIRELRGPLGEP